MKRKEENKKEKLKILAAADLHGNPWAAEKLSEKAEKEKVDLIVLAGDIHGTLESRSFVKPFKDRRQKVLFVPGNWDTSLEIGMMKDMYDVKNIDGYYVTYKDVGIVGVGISDLSLHLDEKSAFEKMKKNFEMMKVGRKKILVSHLHAAGTKAEFSGIGGSRAVRRAIDEFKPDVFIGSHIHEAEGIEEKIGRTKVVQVGPRGTIVEI